MLKIGDKMPSFEVLDPDGKAVHGTLRRSFILNEKGCFLARVVEKVDTINAASRILGG